MLISKASAMGYVKLSADSPEQLRACDVYRVLAAAIDNLSAGEFASFANWLRDKVSDAAKAEIDAYLIEFPE